jgi:ferredoxin
MATLSDRLPENVAGRYYVDSSCIDCDQCRVQAPDFFHRVADSGLSVVVRQPVTPEEIALIEQVVADCATCSIGNDGA